MSIVHNSKLPAAIGCVRPVWGHAQAVTALTSEIQQEQKPETNALVQYCCWLAGPGTASEGKRLK